MKRSYSLLLLCLALVLLISCVPPTREVRNEIIGYSFEVPITYPVEQIPEYGFRFGITEVDQFRIYASTPWKYPQDVDMETRLAAAAHLYLREAISSAETADPRGDVLNAILYSKAVDILDIGGRQWFFVEVVTPSGDVPSHLIYGTICNDVTIMAIHDTKRTVEEARGELPLVLDTFSCLEPSQQAIEAYLMVYANEFNRNCWNIACQATNTEDLNKALSLCDQAIAAASDAPAALDSRAFVLHKMGRIDEAITLYERAVRLNPAIQEHLGHLQCAIAQREDPNDLCVENFCVNVSGLKP